MQVSTSIPAKIKIILKYCQVLLYLNVFNYVKVLTFGT